MSNQSRSNLSFSRSSNGERQTFAGSREEQQLGGIDNGVSSLMRTVLARYPELISDVMSDNPLGLSVTPEVPKAVEAIHEHEPQLLDAELDEDLKSDHHQFTPAATQGIHAVTAVAEAPNVDQPHDPAQAALLYKARIEAANAYKNQKQDDYGLAA